MDSRVSRHRRHSSLRWARHTGFACINTNVLHLISLFRADNSGFFPILACRFNASRSFFSARWTRSITAICDLCNSQSTLCPFYIFRRGDVLYSGNGSLGGVKAIPSCDGLLEAIQKQIRHRVGPSNRTQQRYRVCHSAYNHTPVHVGVQNQTDPTFPQVVSLNLWNWASSTRL